MLNRCEHGNYIPKGDTKSPSCTGCNTASAGILVQQHRRFDGVPPERVLDAAEYAQQSMTDRLTDAAAMEMMTL
jgi:hypothetical protein